MHKPTIRERDGKRYREAPSTCGCEGCDLLAKRTGSSLLQCSVSSGGVDDFFRDCCKHLTIWKLVEDEEKAMSKEYRTIEYKGVTYRGLRISSNLCVGCCFNGFACTRPDGWTEGCDLTIWERIDIPAPKTVRTITVTRANGSVHDEAGFIAANGAKFTMTAARDTQAGMRKEIAAMQKDLRDLTSEIKFNDKESARHGWRA